MSNLCLLLASAVFLLSGCGKGQNLAMSPLETSGGYGVYRSGQPTDDQIKSLCGLGVRQVFALNGEGGKYEQALKSNCPQAEIVYNVMQDADSPTSIAFLQKFDDAVSKARSEGTGILFHCSCGCHRTGRLAAYYRMKYQGWTADQAIKEMLEVGKDMDGHPTLPGQVRAMEDYIKGRSCQQEARYCLVEN